MMNIGSSMVPLLGVRDSHKATRGATEGSSVLLSIIFIFPASYLVLLGTDSSTAPPLGVRTRHMAKAVATEGSSMLFSGVSILVSVSSMPRGLSLITLRLFFLVS